MTVKYVQDYWIAKTKRKRIIKEILDWFGIVLGFIFEGAVIWLFIDLAVKNLF